jgi:Na+-translocating ferredoxin:NAD+ oxidoreductase subunit E
MAPRELTKGLIRTNPVFVLVLGCCPTIATSVEIRTAIAMGIAASFVLIGSNVIISSLRRLVPGGIRIPCYVIVIATFVTIVDLFLKAEAPAISAQIGIFIPLIVVNCIVMGRAEAFAQKNSVWNSFLDGVGMGMGFTLALLLIATLRESLGKGTLAGITLLKDFQPLTVLGQAPGGFLCMGLLLGLFRWIGGLRKAA